MTPPRVCALGWYIVWTLIRAGECFRGGEHLLLALQDAPPEVPAARLRCVKEGINDRLGGRPTEAGHDSEWAAMVSVASKLGCSAERLRKLVRRA